jgi:hypothetical protein
VSNRLRDGDFERLADQVEASQMPELAPSRLKARLYSALMAREQTAGPLRSLPETAAEGRGLCVFEQLVRISPVGQKAKSVFYCSACHARILAEHFEDPPIYWPNCPYVQLKNR